MMRGVSDLEKLQGTWRIAALEMDGRTASAPEFDGATIAISGKTFTSIMTGSTYEGTIRVDETKSPKTLDLLFTTGPQKGTTNPGIYNLRGDAWTFCLAMRGKTRPKTFATKPNTGLVVETLERASTTSTTKRVPSATPPRAAKTARAAESRSSSAPSEIEGEWKMTRGVFNGAPLAPEMAAFCTRITRGDVTKILAGPQEMLHAKFTLDPAQSPRAIDYVNLAGSNKGKAQAGIYARDGDELTISIAAPGKPRPKDFSTAKGDGRTLTVWRRK
jgi:uncharacterized protein (TIGR03067 family)